jgi:hypothetical protein
LGGGAQPPKPQSPIPNPHIVFLKNLINILTFLLY